ncbi:MAG TPA: hypothetical protein VGS01_16315 [Candidatus Limnocylindria bacterium]|jgi:hypothetical protein|nr:hypothetical protein [Candidatus Limnocylindria bacterium]
MTADAKKDTLGTDRAETAREMIEKGSAAGRQYVAAVNAATVAGLRGAFEIQNSFIAAGRSVADASVAASAKLADRVVETITSGQVEATKLAEAGAKLATDALDIRS